MVRRLSSARSRLFRSFRSLSKLRLEGKGQRTKSQQKQPAGERKRGFLKPFMLSSMQSSLHQLRTESTVSVVEDVSISELKTSPGAYFSQQSLPRTGEWGSAMPSYHQTKHQERLFIRLTLRCPRLLRGARVSMISGPILLNSVLGTHSQGIKR